MNGLIFQPYILIRLYHATPRLRLRAPSHCHVTVINRKCAVSLTTRRHQQLKRLQAKVSYICKQIQFKIDFRSL